ARPADRADPVPRRLPEAGAGHDQPGGDPDHAGRRADRPGPDRPGRRAERRRPVTPVLLAADSITAPSLSYSGLLPVLIVISAAALGVLVEAFVPAESRWAAQVGVALVGLLAALVALVA